MIAICKAVDINGERKLSIQFSPSDSAAMLFDFEPTQDDEENNVEMMGPPFEGSPSPETPGSNIIRKVYTPESLANPEGFELSKRTNHKSKSVCLNLRDIYNSYSKVMVIFLPEIQPHKKIQKMAKDSFCLEDAKLLTKSVICLILNKLCNLKEDWHDDMPSTSAKALKGSWQPSLADDTSNEFDSATEDECERNYIHFKEQVETKLFRSDRRNTRHRSGWSILRNAKNGRRKFKYPRHRS